MEPNPLLLGVMILATARTTRLITRDRILKGPRNRALRALPDDHPIAYLLVCDWCVSIYLGAIAGTIGAHAGWWPWTWVLPFTLAASHVAGWLSSREGDE